jgi:hypothetical protein
MTEEVLDDRRAAIEAAFDSVEEAPAAAPAPSEPETTQVDSPSAESSLSPSTEETEKPKESVESEPETAAEPVFSVDKAPQSWRGPQKAKWAALDPDVRQEVIRREREITKTLGETAAARQLANQFAQAVQPFQARLQSMGAAPITAVQRLLQADYALSSAPPAQRAQLMAKLINDYGVDVRALDAALSGQQPDPTESKLEAILNQRLAPLQQFLTLQQQREQAREAQAEQEIAQTVESMTNNPKFPHFEAVRDEMADIVELSSKRGLYLSLEQAYNRAVALNPEVSQQIAAQKEADAKRAAALAQNAKAQKAMRAAVSVSGSPVGAPAGTSSAGDRRATIEAAFDKATSGR